MTRRMARFRCPICRRPVKKSDPHFPFCSERCRLMDLGHWLDGKYRIAAPLPDSEESASPSDLAEDAEEQ